MGDFNYPEINFEQFKVEAGPESSPAKFFDKTQDMFLFQCVLEPTRMRMGQVPSLLDLVFTDEENLIEDMEYHAPLGLSDHVCLAWTLATGGFGNKDECEKIDVWRGNYEETNNQLEKMDWENSIAGDSIDIMWDKFLSIIKDMIQKYIPFKKVGSKRRFDRWISNDTVRMMKERGEA